MNIIDGFRSHPPDLVVWVPRDVSEQGYRHFGPDTGDYGQELYAWIVGNYRPVWVIREHTYYTDPGTGAKVETDNGVKFKRVGERAVVRTFVDWLSEEVKNERESEPFGPDDWRGPRHAALLERTSK